MRKDTTLTSLRFFFLKNFLIDFVDSDSNLGHFQCCCSFFSNFIGPAFSEFGVVAVLVLVVSF